MKPKILATAVGISLLFIMPALVVAPAAATAAPANGLYAAFWNQTFFGGTLATWPSCTQESSPPAGATSSTAPTATEIDPNIAHGVSTGFYWDETSAPGFGSGTGTGFTVGSTTFKNTDFSVEWTGYISLSADTTYYFQLKSDDGSWLYINTSPESSTISASNLIINNANPTDSNGLGDGIQPPTPANSAAVTVSTTGTYPIEVDYYETCDSQSGIDLSWATGSASGFTIIPTTAFTPAAIGSNANIPFSPPSGVPQFSTAAPMVAAIGLLALVLMRRKALPRIGTTA